jgi:hypothetical protein
MQQAILQVLNANMYDGTLECSITELADKIAVELQNKSQTLTCVYCGHEYPPGTPSSNHEALTQHIAVCDKHPMKEVVVRNNLLERVIRACTAASPCCLIDLIGRELYIEAYGDPDDESVGGDENDGTREDGTAPA